MIFTCFGGYFLGTDAVRRLIEVCAMFPGSIGDGRIFNEHRFLLLEFRDATGQELKSALKLHLD
jgi:hypothetical protein